MTRYESHVLTACREALEEVRDLEEEIIAACCTLRAQRMDGMPRGESGADGTALRMIRMEQLERRRRSAQDAYRRYCGMAIPVLEGMMAPTRAFYAAYCVDGLGFDAAWKASGLSRETCRKYAREVGG